MQISAPWWITSRWMWVTRAASGGLGVRFLGRAAGAGQAILLEAADAGDPAVVRRIELVEQQSVQVHAAA